MRFAALSLVFAVGCNTPAGDYFTPDEFHVWGEYGEDESLSEFNRPGGPTSGLSSGSTERSSIGVGFTWHLTEPSAHNLDALRELRRITATLIDTRADLASFVTAANPVAPSGWQPFPSGLPGSWAVPTPSLLQPGSIPTVERHEHPDPAQTGAASFWAQIGSALLMLILTAIGWLNRQRLPWPGGRSGPPAAPPEP